MCIHDKLLKCSPHNNYTSTFPYVRIRVLLHFTHYFVIISHKRLQTLPFSIVCVCATRECFLMWFAHNVRMSHYYIFPLNMKRGIQMCKNFTDTQTHHTGSNVHALMTCLINLWSRIILILPLLCLGHLTIGDKTHNSLVHTKCKQKHVEM